MFIYAIKIEYSNHLCNHHTKKRNNNLRKILKVSLFYVNLQSLRKIGIKVIGKRLFLFEKTHHYGCK